MIKRTKNGRQEEDYESKLYEIFANQKYGVVSKAKDRSPAKPRYLDVRDFAK
jgi:hypothetical protein